MGKQPMARFKRFAPVFFLVLLAVAARADEIVGKPRVIDGDTLQIGGRFIHLHGVDAPESGQSCRASGERYLCGVMATMWLAIKVRGREVRCEGTERNRLGHLIAVCHVGGRDINADLVEAGWALANRRYALDYVDREDAARAAGRGIWRGEFVPPWEWRRR